MAIKPRNQRKPAVPKKPTTSQSSKTQSTSPKGTETTASKANLLQRVARKPVVPSKVKPKVQPKEVETNGTKKEEPKQHVQQSEPGAGKEASKPIITSKRPSEQTEPRPADKREKYAGESRLTSEEMRSITVEDRVKLFRSINGHSEEFYPLLKELPKRMQMRKDEALIRNLIHEKAPKAPRGMVIYYCAYCVDWQPFYNHAWVGYIKCCGCSMSTKDFYICADNGLFGKD